MSESVTSSRKILKIRGPCPDDLPFVPRNITIISNEGRRTGRHMSDTFYEDLVRRSHITVSSSTVIGWIHRAEADFASLEEETFDTSDQDAKRSVFLWVYTLVRKHHDTHLLPDMEDFAKVQGFSLARRDIYDSLEASTSSLKKSIVEDLEHLAAGLSIASTSGSNSSKRMARHTRYKAPSSDVETSDQDQDSYWDNLLDDSIDPPKAQSPLRRPLSRASMCTNDPYRCRKIRSSQRARISGLEKELATAKADIQLYKTADVQELKFQKEAMQKELDKLKTKHETKSNELKISNDKSVTLTSRIQELEREEQNRKATRKSYKRMLRDRSVKLEVTAKELDEVKANFQAVQKELEEANDGNPGSTARITELEKEVQLHKAAQEASAQAMQTMREKQEASQKLLAEMEASSAITLKNLQDANVKNTHDREAHQKEMAELKRTYQIAMKDLEDANHRNTTFSSRIQNELEKEVAAHKLAQSANHKKDADLNEMKTNYDAAMKNLEDANGRNIALVARAQELENKVQTQKIALELSVDHGQEAREKELAELRTSYNTALRELEDARNRNTELVSRIQVLEKVSESVEKTRLPEYLDAVRLQRRLHDAGSTSSDCLADIDALVKRRFDALLGGAESFNDTLAICDSYERAAKRRRVE